MIELEMVFDLGNLCVNIEMWDKKQKRFRETAALFDTGAHTTHIDTNTLEFLGYDLDDAPKGYISTVGNRNIQINNTVIDNVKIGELELGSVLVNFSELSDINSPAVILGMNIIKEFNINLDFKNNIIRMNPNFDIDSSIPIENFRKSGSRFGLWTVETGENNDDYFSGKRMERILHSVEQAKNGEIITKDFEDLEDTKEK